MGQQINGKCLCGSVKLSAETPSRNFAVCHCSMCRQWGGGPSFTVDIEHAVFSGEEFISHFDSSDWAQRGFCKSCGTHLFYKLKQTGYINVPLGLIEQREAFTFHSQIYVDSKPANYDFANRTETLTEAEVIAKFTASNSPQKS